MSDALSNGTFFSKDERDQIRKERRDDKKNLERFEEMIGAVEKYIRSPHKTERKEALVILDRTFSNSSRFVDALLTALEAKNEEAWAFFLEYVHRQSNGSGGYFERLYYVSPFKNRYIAYGTVDREEIRLTIATLGFLSCIANHRLGRAFVVFDKSTRLCRQIGEWDPLAH